MTSAFLRLIRDKWFSDRQNSTVWIRVYSSYGGPVDEIKEYYNNRIAVLVALNDTSVNYCRFSGKMKKANAPIIVNSDGSFHIKFSVDDVIFEEFPCIILASPHKIDGRNADDWITKCKLDILCALLRGYIGRHCLHKIIYEGEYRADNAKREMIRAGWFSPPAPYLQPLLHPVLWRDINEIFNKIDTITEETKKKVNKAIMYYGKGLENPNFYNYWTALETLCGGGAPKIHSTMQKCYGFKRQHDVEADFGFSTIT